jgi:hypothetical protein
MPALTTAVHTSFPAPVSPFPPPPTAPTAQYWPPATRHPPTATRHPRTVFVGRYRPPSLPPMLTASKQQTCRSRAEPSRPEQRKRKDPGHAARSEGSTPEPECKFATETSVSPGKQTRSPADGPGPRAVLSCTRQTLSDKQSATSDPWSAISHQPSSLEIRLYPSSDSMSLACSALQHLTVKTPMSAVRVSCPVSEPGAQVQGPGRFAGTCHFPSRP